MHSGAGGNPTAAPNQRLHTFAVAAAESAAGAVEVVLTVTGTPEKTTGLLAMDALAACPHKSEKI